MTSEKQTEMDRLSPDDLMTGFTRSPIIPALVIAFLLHGVIIGGSLGLGLLFAGDPDAPPDQTTETGDQSASGDDASSGDDGSSGDDDDDADDQANSDDDAQTAQGEPPLDEQGNPIPERVRETEVYQQTQSMPDADELPDEPDLDIDIDDTNVGN